MSSTSPRTIPCRRCGQQVALDQTFFPFCSKRCRMIDLGRWFNEEYRVDADDPSAGEGIDPVLGSRNGE